MLVWDATCPDTYTPLHVSAAAREAGAVAAKAEHLKSAKYAVLKVSHHFAVETSSEPSQAALSLVWDIGQRLRKATGEEHSKEHLLQRIVIAVQRVNAAAVLGTVGRWEDPFWG